MFDNPVAFELAQGFTHGRARQVQPLGHLNLAQSVAGAEIAGAYGLVKPMIGSFSLGHNLQFCFGHFKEA
jgi:hypothetical protein